MAPAVAVGVVLAALLTLTSTLGVPGASGSGASRWIPADGYRRHFTDGSAIASADWARAAQALLVQSGPNDFWNWLTVADEPGPDTTFARFSAAVVDTQGRPTDRWDDLWTLDPQGARTVVESTKDGALIYVPGRLDLPASLAAGATWTSEGEVVHRSADDQRTHYAYRADYRATTSAWAGLPAGRLGCLDVAMEFSVDGGEPQSSQRTWCLGEGIVRTAFGDTEWSASELSPPAEVPLDPGFDWATADRLEFGAHPLNQVGTKTPFVTAVSPPGLLPGGRVVVTNRLVPDVLGLDTTTEPAAILWRGRPGAGPISAATVAGITVVATSGREAIGYGPDGQWLWRASLGDLAAVPPVSVDGTAVAVATLDGAVTVLELTTGAVRWQAGVDAEVRIAPVAAGGRLLVGDQAGALTCFDTAGNPLWTIDTGRIARFAVTTGEDPVVVVARADSPMVRTYSLDDGGEVWRHRYYQDARDLIVLDSAVVLRDDERTIAIDHRTGEPLWNWEAQRTFAGVGGGHRVLLLGGSELVLLDADGRQLRTWPHTLGDVANSETFLAASGEGIVAYGPEAMAIGGTP